jgi:hypothetical protein
MKLAAAGQQNPTPLLESAFAVVDASRSSQFGRAGHARPCRWDYRAPPPWPHRALVGMLSAKGAPAVWRCRGHLPRKACRWSCCGSSLLVVASESCRADAAALTLTGWTRGSPARPAESLMSLHYRGCERQWQEAEALAWCSLGGWGNPPPLASSYIARHTGQTWPSPKFYLRLTKSDYMDRQFELALSRCP